VAVVACLVAPALRTVAETPGRGARRAARTGWNDLYFVPLLLSVACASLTPAIALSFWRGGEGLFHRAHELRLA
jgi:hypothetical protein